MSKPVFSDLFKFSGRRNRQSYNLLLLSQIGALILLCLFFGIGIALLDGVEALGWLMMIFVVGGFVAVGVSGWAAGSQRIRDFGQSGVWILATLIPYVGIAFSLALMFIPSSTGENKYGPSCI